jgi:arylsulfatase A-like enzyme
MVQFDWSTGEVLRALEENGLSDNTLVIFSSDNGPVYDDGYEDGTTVRTSTKESDRGHDGSGPYRGGKYQVYEGGTRVPFIAKWPGRIKPGISDATMNQIDFLASFAALLGIELADTEAIDSRNMLPALLGEQEQGLPFLIEESNATIALREGDWKYVSKPAPMKPKRNRKKKQGAAAPRASGLLFNLKSDVGESNNVIAENEELAEKMRVKLEALRTDARGVRALADE